MTGLRSLQQRRSQQKVAAKHSHFVIEYSIYRQLSTTFRALVHHVVVYQAGRVQQLQRGSRMKRGGTDFAPQQLGRKQYQHRAHHFPRLVPDVLDDMLQQQVGAGKRTVEQPLEVFHLPDNRCIN